MFDSYCHGKMATDPTCSITVCYCIYDHTEVLCDCCFPTLHVEQLVLCGDLRGALGHSLAVEDALMVKGGALQDEALGGVIGHQRPVGRDLLWRDFSVQGHLGLRVSYATRHHGGLVRAQVHDLKVDGRRDEEVFSVCFKGQTCDSQIRADVHLSSMTLQEYT